MTYDFHGMTGRQRASVARFRPTTEDELHYWIAAVFGLDIPRAARCPDHNAPFDYVRDAYFQRFTDACVWANRGGGKTLLGAVVSVLDAVFRPGILIRILGGSLEQSRKMYQYILRLLQRPGVGQLLYDSEAERETAPAPGRKAISARTIRFANGSEIEILAQSERSVRGNRVQKMRCDEVELFDTDVWTSCQLVVESRDVSSECGTRNAELAGDHESSIPNSESPVANCARGAVEAFSTFHRTGGLMQNIVEQAGRRGSPVYRWCVLDVLEQCPPSRDCQGCVLHPECGGRARAGVGFFKYHDAVAAKTRVSDETWQAEMLCLRPSRRGAVFPAFSRARHVGPIECQPGWPTFRAIDFGYVNPFVCLWVQVSPGGDVLVLREYLRARATLDANVAAVVGMDPGPIVASYCDPAGGQADQITGTTARDELRSAGIKTIAKAAPIVHGLELIRRRLDGQLGTSRPGLRIDPSCERLILAMEAYRYAERCGDRPASEQPLKDGVHDHPIDALRYFFVNHFTTRYRTVERLY